MDSFNILVRTIKAKHNKWRFLQNYDANPNKNAIFCFHGFYDSPLPKNYIFRTPKKLFADTLHAISKKFEIVLLSELIETCVKEGGDIDSNPKAAFTIDDGFASIMDIIDIFQFYSVVPTVFVCSQLIDNETVPFPEIIRIAVLLTKEKYVELPQGDQKIIKLHNINNKMSLIGQWIEYFQSVPRKSLELEVDGFLNRLKVSHGNIRNSKSYDPLLDWKQLKGLHDFIEIGSHTCSHSKLSSLTDIEAKIEIYESKKMIEQNLTVKCPSFAYPFGDKLSFGEREEHYVEQSGYQAAFSLEPGYLSSTSSMYSLPRFNVGNTLKVLTTDLNKDSKI